MKELIRRSLQTFIQKGTFGTESVGIWCLNSTMLKLIPSIIKSKRKVVFLPKCKNRKFDAEYFGGNLDLPVERIPDMVGVLVKYFNKYKIRYYVLDKLPLNDMFYHAALTTAKACSDWGVEIIYIDHGDSAQANLPSELMWLNLVDYYYARDIDMRDHLRNLSMEHSINVRVSCWEPPLLINKIRKDDKLLMYAPAFHCRETFGTCYSDTLKYKNREVMLYALESLAARYDLKILWKYMVGEEGYDAVPDLIKRFGFKRIVYEDRGNFDFWLAKANMFVSDCASTTLYSAVRNGVKSLALWDSRLPEIRESAGNMLNNCVFVYDDIGEALARLETFVRRCVEGQDWIKPTIPTKQDRYPWEC